MRKASITIHPDFTIGEISGRLFGAFLEPIGSMVNGSMFNPKHPAADSQGLRKDFYDALKEAGLPAVRLPGGNFVSGWNWKDSIGPMAERKAHLDMAWFQYIPNDVGHDEYLQWAEKAGAEAIYTVNLGTGTLQDAADCVEYTNHEGGTWWSDLRKKNGHAAPYGVKTWCLGNEMDGPWQIASYEKDPRGYGVLAHETSTAMKWVDPTIETIACVSSSPFLNHYPDWDLEVLQECYAAVDYISLHHYHSAPPDMPQALMAGYQAYEDYIRTEIALCDFVKTKLRSKKTMMLALDAEAGELTVFVINADAEEEQELKLDARGFEGWEFTEHIEMFSEDPEAANTWDRPDRILPRTNTETKAEKGILTARLKKESWNMLCFRKA